MSPAAEIRGVTVTCGLGAPFVLKKVPLWAHLLGRGLEELCHQEGGRGGAAFRPLASPTLRAGASEPPTGAADWKGGVACICSRPEGATEVVPPQAEATRSLAPPGTLPPCWGHPDWEPVGPRTQRPAVPQAQSLQPCPHATSRTLRDHPRETEPSGDKQTIRSFDRKVRSRATRPWLLYTCFLVAGLLLGGAQSGFLWTGQLGESLVL